ncbi:short-chain dehydrogenase, partial [Paraburkholderia sp. Se-20369]|nr:short-chain dehydrogenase [Paraburkholderia sp. Se-20369]
MHAWSARHVPAQGGKVAVVTGANSGLGWQLAETLAAKGAT